MKSLYRKVDSFDGQIITIDGKHCYELGAFLGGGAAGVVYEGANISDKLVVRPVAIKILNPVGFRLAPAVTLRRCLVAKRGQPVGGSPTSESCSSPSGFMGSAAGMETGLPGGSACSGRPGLAGGVHGGATNSRASKLGPENVWWLVSPNTKQVIAAYVDARYGNLVELPLTKCIQIWGLNPNMEASASCGSPNRETRGSAERKERDDNAGVSAEADGPSADASWGSEGFEVQVDGIRVCIPWLPPKYVQWLAQRRKVKREINNMSKVGGHRNVVKLLSVLELIQDSKSTLFLILELVTGGELLDHIRLLGDKSSRAWEASALRADGSTQHYFRQLLSGLAYCHRQGICHRDLSPSNLLLAESPQRDARLVLKIADFGLSACCAGNENQDAASSRRGLPQRVKSIVGSPHYMAPEVNSSNAKGYDGFKADAWSCGVVLFTMLTASLPFDRDLTRCPRFKRFKHWANKHSIGIAPSRATSAVTGVASEGALSTTSYSPPPSSSLSTSLAPSSASSGSSAATPAPSSPPAPPAWLFPSSIHPAARSLLVSLLVPNPSRRMGVEQALNHPWLTGGWTGDAMGNDGVSSGPDPAVAGGAAASKTPKDGPPSPSSRVVTSSTAGSKGESLIGEVAGVHHPVADGYRETVNRRQDDVLGSRWEGGNWGLRHGAQGQDTRRVREERVGQKGAGNVGGGRVGGWRGWTADITSEELLSFGSLPSTSSYP